MSRLAVCVNHRATCHRSRERLTLRDLRAAPRISMVIGRSGPGGGMRGGKVRRSGRYVAVGVVAMLALAGCGSGGGGGGGSSQVRIEGAPAVIAGPNERAPLVRILRVDTNVPTRLDATVSDGADSTFTIASTELTTSHTHTILGVKPDRPYQVTFVVTAADGARHESEEPLVFTTTPLPDNFPVLDVRTADAARTEPGVTLFGARNKNLSASYLVIVDGSGEVIWYLDVDTGSFVRQRANGNLITISSDRTRILEIDLLGQTVRTWYAALASATPPAGGIPVDVFTFHNDVFEIESAGTFLTSADFVHLVDDFPTDENDPSVRATAPVLDEPIVEFTADGTTTRTWNFVDLLKPTRIAFDATLGLPAAADWAHTNAVILDPRDDAIIASLRHQDALVKASRVDGTLRWILGPHDNWEGFEAFLLTPVGEPFAWPYHQHAPQITARGTLLVFDNGNYKASPFTGQMRIAAAENFSRAVEYEIDENARTVRQVWEFVATEQLYAPFVGSAYELATTENVLITYGGLCTIDGLFSDDIQHCRGTARLIEVDRGEPDTVVFDVEVRDRDPNAIGWLVYRAYRIPPLAVP
jgi:arylsulfate sulfotransferase